VNHRILYMDIGQRIEPVTSEHEAQVLGSSYAVMFFAFVYCRKYSAARTRMQF
jgi:hypothetical protein